MEKIKKTKRKKRDFNEIMRMICEKEAESENRDGILEWNNIPFDGDFSALSLPKKIFIYQALLQSFAPLIQIWENLSHDLFSPDCTFCTFIQTYIVPLDFSIFVEPILTHHGRKNLRLLMLLVTEKVKSIIYGEDKL